MQKKNKTQIISYSVNILPEPNMPINLASAIKFLTFFLFGDLMFFGVGKMMEVEKIPILLRFVRILILLNSFILSRVE